MPFVYLTFRHSVRPEGGQAFPTFGIRCWKLGGAAGAAPVVCGQVCDVSPNEAFVKALAGRCTREGLEPCHCPVWWKTPWRAACRANTHERKRPAENATKGAI